MTLQINKLTVCDSETYHFWFDRWGWATFIICEDLCEFAIISDWGNYSHRWPKNGMAKGETLKDFLTACHPEYVLTKFSYSRTKDLEDDFNGEATVERFKKLLCDARRERSITAEEARDALDDLRLMDEDVPSNLFLERVPSLLWRIEPDLYELIVKEPSARWRFLNDELLPFFFGWLRERGHGKREAAS
jgi:hypothetical protein